MINKKAQINLFDPVFVDCFAGGGGWSTGAEFALGRPIDIAVNHDYDAVLMHKTNHPYTRHYCEDIYAVSPKEAVSGKPVEKKIRGSHGLFYAGRRKSARILSV